MDPDRRTASEPKPCLGGCGFFGNTAYDNYCSKCYKALARTPSLTGAWVGQGEAPRGVTS